MDGNELCGVWKDVRGDIHGTYTTLGITKLCEGLKGSAVTSLRRAATQVFDFVSAPLDTLQHSPPFPWSQSEWQRIRSQRRTRSRQRPEGQLVATKAHVRRACGSNRPWAGPFAFVSANWLARLSPPLLPCSQSLARQARPWRRKRSRRVPQWQQHKNTGRL